MNKRKNNRQYLRNRMTIYFSSVFFIASVILILFYFQRTVQNVNKETVIYVQNNISGQNEMYGSFIEYMDQLTLNMRADKKLMGILADYTADTTDMEYLENQLKNFWVTQKNISTIQLCVPNLDILFTLNVQKTSVTREQEIGYKNSEFLGYYEEALKSKNYSYIFTKNQEIQGKKSDLFYARVLLDVSDKSPLGILVVQFNQNIYQKMIGNWMNEETVFCGIFGKENEPLLNNDNSYFMENQEEIVSILNMQTGSNGFSVIEKNGILTAMKNSDGIKYLEIISKAGAQDETRKTVAQSLVLLIGITLVFIYLIWIVSKNITRPIMELAEQMKRVDLDNAMITIQNDKLDEIGYLNLQFEKMIQKINALVEEKYVSKINENNARLKALQAQINPHFLYNTLQVISTQAVINDNWKIVEMVESLANFYRYAAKVGDEVTVGQEIDNLENYLRINKYRYEEQLEYVIDIDDGTRDMVIPKFTFQILAENAIKHGMDDNVLNLKLQVKKVGDEIIFRSSDDGRAFDENKKRLLFECLEKNQLDVHESHGLGLRNLCGRFFGMYGMKNVKVAVETVGHDTIVEFKVKPDYVSKKKEVCGNVENIDD